MLNKRLGPYIDRARWSAYFLSKILGADIEEQLDLFQSKGLIARRKNCPACTNPMDLQKKSDITDKYRYNMTKLRQKVAK